ncbi:hypothetical protein RHGRI_029889 [Rhododendron griersonianum]|uniref:Uncharacterized protein n=1 Tax=Rhododendron griersonianum TaxID=479676 RepID=A0AAV6IP48_9ERIC|nr:hypothetical protein RHGRI_029889 [Rhododendron griersonianum]
MAVSSSTTAAALHYISKPQQNYAPRTTTTTTCSSCSFSVSITSSLSKTTKKPLKVTVRSSSDGSASAETTVTQAEAEAESESPIELPKGPPSVISTLNVERALRGIPHTNRAYRLVSERIGLSEHIDLKEGLYEKLLGTKFGEKKDVAAILAPVSAIAADPLKEFLAIGKDVRDRWDWYPPWLFSEQLQILITMAVLEFRKDVQMIRSAIKTSPVLNLGTSSSLGPGRAVVAFCGPFSGRAHPVNRQISS